MLSGSRFKVQGFNPNRTIVHAESPQLAQEKPGFNGTKLKKQPLNREPGTLNLSSYHFRILVSSWLCGWINTKIFSPVIARSEAMKQPPDLKLLQTIRLLRYARNDIKRGGFYETINISYREWWFPATESEGGWFIKHTNKLLNIF